LADAAASTIASKSMNFRVSRGLSLQQCDVVLTVPFWKVALHQHLAFRDDAVEVTSYPTGYPCHTGFAEAP
jgi:hypothetical protein